MGETILSVAIIGALFSGATLLFKQLFSRNENKALEYTHTERMIELLSKQNQSSEKLIDAVEGLRIDLKNLADRVDKLEENRAE